MFLGAQEVLKSTLGIECETNFNVSPTYPKGHFSTVQEILLARKLIAFDANFNRIPRASFQAALLRKGLKPVSDQDGL